LTDKNIKLIFGPDCIDGVWTIDIVDENGEPSSRIYASRREAEEDWERLRKTSEDGSMREQDK